MNTLRSFTFIFFACAGLCICEKEDEGISAVEYSFINGTSEQLEFTVYWKSTSVEDYTVDVLPNDTIAMFGDSFPYQQFESIDDISTLDWPNRLDSLVINSESGFYRKLLGTDFQLDQFDFDTQHPSMASMYYLIE